MSRRTNKICLFIDNNAFSQLLQGKKVNFKRLKNWLCGSREAALSFFYCGETNRTEFSRNGLYESLRTAGFEVKVSRNPTSRADLPERDEAISHSISVGITWDMSQLLSQGYYDAFVILSGSFDLSQVVSEIRKKGVDVEVVFDPERCSPTLRGASTRFRCLDIEQLLDVQPSFS